MTLKYVYLGLQHVHDIDTLHFDSEGDLLLTGTPEGVGPMRAGQVSKHTQTRTREK